MTRIGDSGDEQRIQEMIEADHRQKVDTQKRADGERVTKSFQEVMAQRASKETSKSSTAVQANDREAAAQKKSQAEQAAQKKTVLGNPKSQELQKRAQMATQQQGQLNRTRSELSEGARALEGERSTELVKKTDDDRDRISKDIDADRETDVGVQDHLAKMQDTAPIGVDDDAADRGRGKRESGGQKDDGENKAPAAIAKAEGAQGTTPTKIPQELIDYIAKSVAIAVAADGRTEIAVSLKGTMLDGVTLHVSAKKGKVRCVFEGCDRQLANLIESSKGELMRQLGKRGLELDILRAK